jgi:hypothetical protein
VPGSDRGVDEIIWGRIKEFRFYSVFSLGMPASLIKLSSQDSSTKTGFLPYSATPELLLLLVILVLPGGVSAGLLDIYRWLLSRRPGSNKR